MPWRALSERLESFIDTVGDFLPSISIVNERLNASVCSNVDIILHSDIQGMKTLSMLMVLVVALLQLCTSMRLPEVTHTT